MTELHIRVGEYRVTRHADEVGGPPVGGEGRYEVYRPDGTQCCKGAMWADVERVIEEDRKRGDKGMGAD